MKLLSGLKLPPGYIQGQPGYIQGQLDHIVFARIFNGDKFAILIVYVRDILRGDDIVEMERLKKNFHKSLRSRNEVRKILSWHGVCSLKERSCGLLEKVHYRPWRKLR